LIRCHQLHLRHRHRQMYDKLPRLLNRCRLRYLAQMFLHRLQLFNRFPVNHHQSRLNFLRLLNTNYLHRRRQRQLKTQIVN
jgi:hypothetical protein